MKRLLSLSCGVLAGAALMAPAAASAAGTCTPPYCPAPKAQTTTATNITQTTATLNGIVNTNGADTTYHFEIRTEAGTVRSPNDTISGATSTDQAVSTAVSGLSPGTTYFFRVVAVGVGGATYGAVVSFTTAGDPGTGTSKSVPTFVAPNSTPVTTLIARRSAATISGIANVLQSRGVGALFSGRVAARFAAPHAGTFKAEVFAVGVRGRASAVKPTRVLLARGTQRFANAGRAKVRLKPTASRRVLGHARRVRLLIRTTFTPRGGKPVVRGRNVTVRR